ncbi:MAG: hypothetical protein HYS09_07030, partial [Chloroflexi bacterium]|nr:hypothetical protein [Chloroflexota bacterium]
QVEAIVRRSLTDEERGLGGIRIDITDDTIAALARAPRGDARVALNALELAASTAQPQPPAPSRRSSGRSRPQPRPGDRPQPRPGDRPQPVIRIDLADIEEALQRPTLLYDKAGDYHYDIISAFIKSLRGSDPDAALYWLARMVEAGEDPLFIARRLVILAAEDVGLADPQALVVAMACQQAVHFVGMPEGYLPLAEATIYLATAPKSNSALQAYQRALKDVKATLNEPVPLHLRNPATPLMEKMGYGRDYQYDHAYPEHYSGQTHLPDKLSGRRYYLPTTQGYEKRIVEHMQRLRDQAGEQQSEGPRPPSRDPRPEGREG